MQEIKKRWQQSTGSVDKYLKQLLDWLHKRVAYIDGYAAGSMREVP